MSWVLTLLRLALGSAWKLAGAVLGPVRRWLLADVRHPVIAVLAVAVAAYWFAIVPGLRDQLMQERADHARAVAAHERDIKTFRAAAREADRLDAANADRAVAEQAAITERVSHDYKAKVEALRARALAGRSVPAAGGVRREARAAARGAGGAALPGLSAAPGRADAPPGKAGLPLAAAMIANEQALQLDALISWAEAQAAVDPNAAPAQ